MKFRPENEHFRYDVAEYLKKENRSMTAAEIAEGLNATSANEKSAVSNAIQYLVARGFAQKFGKKGSRNLEYSITMKYKNQLSPEHLNVSRSGKRKPPRPRTEPHKAPQAALVCTHTVQVPVALLKMLLRTVQQCGAELTEGQKTALLGLYASII
jgi:hypothetical protein